MADFSFGIDVDFLTKSSQFLLNTKLSQKNIDFRDLLTTLDKDIIRDFIQLSIKSIVVSDKRIHSITFNNGMVNEFAYAERTKSKNKVFEKFAYREYEPMILEYVKENRSQAEQLTGMKRTGALSMLNELVERGVLEKVGASIAVRYVSV